MRLFDRSARTTPAPPLFPEHLSEVEQLRTISLALHLMRHDRGVQVVKALSGILLDPEVSVRARSVLAMGVSGTLQEYEFRGMETSECLEQHFIRLSKQPETILHKAFTIEGDLLARFEAGCAPTVRPGQRY